MKDLKIVLYKENNSPKTISLSSKTILKLASSVGIFFLVLFFTSIVSIRYYLKIKNSNFSLPQTSSQEEMDSLDRNDPKVLKDKIEQLTQQLENQKKQEQLSKNFITDSPVLALFSPIVRDETHIPKVEIKNFKFSSPSQSDSITLSFELHNNDPDSGSQKGYIIVIAKSPNAIEIYPNAINIKDKFLIDFEKGETFNIARFRMVNAQFESIDKNQIKAFQIFIFNREGKLWINKLVEGLNLEKKNED
jgi:hypothetical protein